MKNKIFQALSDKIQRNASRLAPNSELVLDFTKVLSIDGGASAGVVDGVGFALKFDQTLTINIVKIQVRR